MLVHPVVIPGSGIRSWTVLGDDGVPVVPVDRFLAYLTDIGRSPNTVKAYAHDLKNYWEFISFRSLDWREARLEDIGEFVAWLRLPPAGRSGEVAVLPVAAALRHELTRSKAVQALRELDLAGTPVTFAGVAQTAGISRSWLYTQPDISDQIRRLRQSTGVAGAVPADQRATEASLRTRLTAALDRNKQLADENARLRRQLARALGDQRSARTRSGNDQGG